MRPLIKLNHPNAVPILPLGAISATNAFSTPSVLALNKPNKANNKKTDVMLMTENPMRIKMAA